MSEIIEFFTTDFLGYPLWLNIVMIIVIMALTQVLKLPIKHFTDKITDKTKRDRVNAVIVLIPIVLSLIAQAIFTACWGYKFTEAVLVWSGTGQIIYEVASRIFARIKKGENITMDIVKSDIETARKDVAESVKSAVDTLTEDLPPTAEQEFEALVKKIKKNTK